MYVSTILMVEPGVVGDPTVSIWLEIETVVSRAMNELPAMETLPDTVAKDRCSPSTQPLASSGSTQPLASSGRYADPELDHLRGRGARLRRNQKLDDYRSINALNLCPLPPDFKPWRRA